MTITFHKDRAREALIDACNVRSTQKLELPVASERYTTLGDLLRENRYEPKVVVPVSLWATLDSALDLAKCRYRGSTKRSLSRTHSKLRRYLKKDLVTRLSLIAGEEA